MAHADDWELDLIGRVKSPASAKRGQSERNEHDGDASLPEGWGITPLAKVASYSTKPRLQADRQIVPFVPMSAIPAGNLYLTSWEHRAAADVRSGVYFQEGDVLLAKITPCLENGKQGLVRGVPGGWGIATTEVYPIHPERVLGEYLAFYLMQPTLRRDLAAKMEGTTGRQRLPKAVVDGLPVVVPPFTEQQAIAQVLLTVQRAREAAEAALGATRELKRSLLRHLFTYGPVAVEEADRIALQETSYGAAPSNWRLLSLGECAEIQSGVTKGRDLTGSPTVDLPYLRVANVQDGYLDLSEIKTIAIRADEVDRYQLRVGDVLMTEGGDPDKLGRGFIWRGEIPLCFHQNHIFAVRPTNGVLDTEYFSFLIQSDYGKAYFLQVAHRTTNLASINLTKLKAMPVLLPPMDVQRTIAEYASTVDAKIRYEERRRQAIDALFKSLLDQLMTGKIRVPTDAPMEASDAAG